ALQAGTKSGATPKAAQNSTLDAFVRLSRSNEAAAVVANETAAPAAASTAACKTLGETGTPRKPMILARSQGEQTKLPTRFPTVVQRKAGIFWSCSASHAASDWAKHSGDPILTPIPMVSGRCSPQCVR